MPRPAALRFLVLACFSLTPARLPASPAPVTDDCRNGEFQFSVQLNNAGVDGHPAHDYTAYLWIPPTSRRLRGAIVTHENVGEQAFTESPFIRAACQAHDLAIVWTCPPLDQRFQTDREAATKQQEHMLEALGRISGYDELGRVPWITFGHSNTIIYARNAAEARPDRVLAAISAKGGISFPPAGSYAGPLLFTAGEFPEWRQPTHDWKTHGASLEGLKKIRDAQAENFRPYSYVEEYGGGHFDYSEPYLRFLALYLEKAVQYRLRPDGSVRPIGQDEGVIVDLRPPLPQPPLTIAPVADAPAALRNGIWFFDRELAAAAAALMNVDWHRKNQIVAFANLDGTPATFSKSGIVDPVPMEMAPDGVTIRRIETTFLEKLPANFTQAGMEFGHAAAGARTIERVSGVFAVENGHYRIALNRGYPDTPNFIAVRHPGDAEYRPSVQPGRLVVPAYGGRAQQIVFAEIPAQTIGAKTLRLHATSSAGLQPEFFVRAGPAKIVGDELIFLPLPLRTRFPVAVTVVAWQLGHGGAEPVAAAPMVERRFELQGAR